MIQTITTNCSKIVIKNIDSNFSLQYFENQDNSMKFVVELANFCPRVITIPDEDVPEEVLQILLNESDEDGLIVMEHEDIGDGMTRHIQTEAIKIAQDLLDVYESNEGTMKYHTPDWTKNARVTRHRSFNKEHLMTNCNFYFIEDYHLDEMGEYIKPVHDTVGELLGSYK